MAYSFIWNTYAINKIYEYLEIILKNNSKLNLFAFEFMFSVYIDAYTVRCRTTDESHKSLQHVMIICE